MKRPTRRTVVGFGVVAIIAASFLIWRYALTPRPKKLTNVTIATFSKALGNSPYHVAKHFRWFEESSALHGVTITYKEYNDRPAISDAFSRRDLQVLFSAEVPSILCRAQGNDIRIVALSANVGQSILVRNDGPLQEVADLRGKTLAVLQGTSSHYGLLKILKAHGLREDDIQLQYMGAAEARVAFESGKLDAWAVWAPFVEQQEVSGKGRLITGGDAMINSVMSVSAPFLKEHPEAARAIVAAIERAKKWIADNPAEAQRIAAEELGLDPRVVAKAWPKHNWTAALDERVITDIQEKATFMAQQDKTRQSKALDVRKELVDGRFGEGNPK